jgi:hypothetical protein
MVSTKNHTVLAQGSQFQNNPQQQEYMDNTLIKEGLHQVFVKYISSHLYVDDLRNLYMTCKDMENQLDQSGRYINKKICLHYQPHSVDDLPAFIGSDGRQIWYKEGKLHRDGDLPAFIGSDGYHSWYKEGKRHRDGDLPAEINSNGAQAWYKEGELDRDGDLPAIISSNGGQFWYKEGTLHRDGDLPAIINSNGGQFWYKQGKLHRDGDLPAEIFANGSYGRKTS